MALNNYTLGRGEVYMATLDASQAPGDFRYVGNSVEFNLTSETESLEHTNPDEGVNEVDRSVQLSVTRTGTLLLDDIQRENLAAFFLGEIGKRDNTVVAPGAKTRIFDADGVTGLVNRIDDGMWTLLGVTAQNPVGDRNLATGANISAAADANGALAGDRELVAGTDYEVDLVRGRFRLLAAAKSKHETEAITSITLSYTVQADMADQVISGSTAISVAIKFFEENPRGEKNDWSLPVVELSPNGDLSLKGDEWRQVPLNLSVQSPSAPGVAAIYANGVEQP